MSVNSLILDDEEPKKFTCGEFKGFVANSDDIYESNKNLCF